MKDMYRFTAIMPLIVPNMISAQGMASNTLIGDFKTCLSIVDDAPRLECMDRAARTLVDAAARRDVVVVAREDVRKSRRSLFGLNLDSGDLFAGRDTPAEPIDTLDTTVRTAMRERHDRWMLTLAEGGRWVTSEAWLGDIDPKPGLAVTIKRAALGSYILRTKGMRAVKVQRMN
jgi:hypothetical protein